MFKKLGVIAAVVGATAALATGAYASSAGSVQVTHSATISCTQKDGMYVVRFGRTWPDGVVFRGVLAVHGYHGPGNYLGRLTVYAHRPGHTAAGTWRGVRVILTQGGGKAGAVSWRCNS
jgi:hypothetical protein